MNGKTHTHYFIAITNNHLLCNLSEILHACEEALTERIQNWFCIQALLCPFSVNFINFIYPEGNCLLRCCSG